tara:strand:- start:618 stop:1250 length:633 start_codon:yes stop_codon:yes gene_type:complete
MFRFRKFVRSILGFKDTPVAPLEDTSHVHTHDGTATEELEGFVVVEIDETNDQNDNALTPEELASLEQELAELLSTPHHTEDFSEPAPLENTDDVHEITDQELETLAQELENDGLLKPDYSNQPQALRREMEEADAVTADMNAGVDAFNRRMTEALGGQYRYTEEEFEADWAALDDEMLSEDSPEEAPTRDAGASQEETPASRRPKGLSS